eukprot:jgi/Picsp_1/1778/NSC_05249-R2_metalloprotease
MMVSTQMLLVLVDLVFKVRLVVGAHAAGRDTNGGVREALSRGGDVPNVSALLEKRAELFFNHSMSLSDGDDPRAPILSEQVRVSQDACLATATVEWSPPSYDGGSTDRLVSYEVLCLPDGSESNENNNNLVRVLVTGIGSMETSQVVGIVPGYSYTCQVGATYEEEGPGASSVVYSRASMAFVYEYQRPLDCVIEAEDDAPLVSVPVDSGLDCSLVCQQVEGNRAINGGTAGQALCEVTIQSANPGFQSPQVFYGTQASRDGCPVNGDPTRSIFDKEGSFRCICTSLGEETGQLPWQSGKCQDDFASVSFSVKSPGICRVVTGSEEFTMGYVPQGDNVCKIVSQDQSQASSLLDVLCYGRDDQIIQLPDVFPPPGDPSGEIQDVQINSEGNTVAIRFWYLDDSFITSQGFFSVYERKNGQVWDLSATREISIQDPLVYGASYMSMDGLGSTIALGDDNADKLFIYEKGPLDAPWTVQTIFDAPTVTGEFEPMFLFGRQPVLNSDGGILVTAGTSISYDYAVVYKKEEGSWKKDPFQFFSPGSALGATELDYIGITAMDISGDGKHVVVACDTIISGVSDGSTNVILYYMDEVTGRYGSPTQIFVRNVAFGLVDQVAINNDGTRVVIGGALLESILVLTIGEDPTVVERTDEIELETSIYSSFALNGNGDKLVVGEDGYGITTYAFGSTGWRAVSVYNQESFEEIIPVAVFVPTIVDINAPGDVISVSFNLNSFVIGSAVTLAPTNLEQGESNDNGVVITWTDADETDTGVIYALKCVGYKGTCGEKAISEVSGISEGTQSARVTGLLPSTLYTCYAIASTMNGDVCSSGLDVDYQTEGSCSSRSSKPLGAPRTCGNTDPTPEEIQAVLASQIAIYGQPVSDISGSQAVTLQSVFPGAQVPVHFYVCDSSVTDDKLTEQISVLNQDYKSSRIGFTTAEIIRCSGTALTDYQAKCNSGSSDFYTECYPYLVTVANRLNKPGMLTIVGPADDGPLGVANRIGLNSNLPFVYIDDGSVPGGTTSDYNLGRTLTHEYGHILGLFHTFEPYDPDSIPPKSGCDSPGDFISDTPYEAEPSFYCPLGGDTCSANPGLDPINNFMDY